MALLVGGWLAREEEPGETGRQSSGRIASLVFLIIAVAGAVAGIVLLFSARPPAPGTDLADLLKKNPQDYDFSLGHFLDLTPEALGMFRAPLFGAVASLLTGASLNWLFRRRKRPVLGNAVLTLMMVGLLTCVHVGFSIFSPILSSRALAVAIQQKYQAGDLIVVDGQYHEAATLQFYTGLPLRILHEPSGSLWYGAKFPDAPHVFETEFSFADLWAGPNTVFLWTDQDDPKELHGMTSFVLARSGGKSILTNHAMGR
jgi:hypothetical protein